LPSGAEELHLHIQQIITKIFFATLLLMCLPACNREQHAPTMPVSLVFYPRTCTCLWVAHGPQNLEKFYSKPDNDPSRWTDTINNTKFYISFMTGNKELTNIPYYGKNFPFLTFYDGYEKPNGVHISSLEEEIQLDYEKYYFSQNNSTTNGELNSSLKNISYRTNGVTKLKISSIDKPLFGIGLNESLNDYFEVKFPYQSLIASYKTKSLIYGCMDEDKPTTIDEWLHLFPLAQPTMLFYLKAIPDGLPITTRFRIDLETDDGMQLSDTTRMITLTK
jgi:hypothetical protein